jgi:hypothetical protein
MRQLIAGPCGAANEIAFLQQCIERLERRILLALQLAAELRHAPDGLLREQTQRIQDTNRSLVHHVLRAGSIAAAWDRRKLKSVDNARLPVFSKLIVKPK